jgi:hypothetical protein
MICAVETAGMAIAASADNIQMTSRKRRMHVPLEDVTSLPPDTIMIE